MQRLTKLYKSNCFPKHVLIAKESYPLTSLNYNILKDAVQTKKKKYFAIRRKINKQSFDPFTLKTSL